MQQLFFKSRVALVVMAAIALAASALAQSTLVMGTGKPDADIPAVQAAVNVGGEVILNGHFSFDKPPTVTTGLQAIGIRMPSASACSVNLWTGRARMPWWLITT